MTASQKNEIPTSWAICTVADITLPVSKVDPKSNPNREIRYIDISGIDNQSNKIADTKTYTLSQAPSRARQIVQAGDVVFSTVRPYLRNIASVGTALDGEIASTGFAVLRPAEGIAPEFLFYKTISQGFVEEISGKQYGASYPAVKDSQIRSVTLSLPPSNEQRRIVEKIETLFARLDQGEAALRQVQKLLARYRQSVLKAAVTGELTRDWRAENAHRLEHGRDLLARILHTRRQTWQGRGQYKEPAAPDTTGLPDLPEGWMWATVEQLGFVVSGQTPKGVEALVDPAGTIPWFKVSSMNEPGNEVDLKTSQWMFTESGAKAAGLNLLPAGAIVFPKRGGAILTNKKRRLGCRAALDLNTMGVVPVELCEFVWTFFQGIDLRSIYDGSNVPQINYHDVADVPFPVPSCVEEAELIADLAKKRVDQIDHLESWCQTELTRSAALRQSILKDAFAGKLVPQDPADEPAAELLARIRASRAAAPAKPRNKASA